jgi:hypothetical protein
MTVVNRRDQKSGRFGRFRGLSGESQNQDTSTNALASGGRRIGVGTSQSARNVSALASLKSAAIRS